MLMSRKRNIKNEMFQPMTDCEGSSLVEVDEEITVWIDDVTGQAVPESGTGHTECSVADGCKPHSRYLQSMSLRWLEPMRATHVSYADKVVGQVLRSQCMQRSEDEHRQLDCMRSDVHNQWRLVSVSVTWSERQRPVTEWAAALRRHKEAGIPIRVAFP